MSKNRFNQNISLKELVCIIVGLMLLVQPCTAQETIDLSFKTVYRSQGIDIGNSIYVKEINDSIQIDLVRFYISDLSILSADMDTLYRCGEHRLIDLQDSSSLTQKLQITSHKAEPAYIVFELGVDSLINDGGAQGGDLDPVNGMYWSWQSGYVNFKLEGSSPVCDTRHHKFNFHLGGFLAPYESIQKVVLPIVNLEQSTVALHLDEFVQNIDFKGMPNIMKPGIEAVSLSQLLARSFSIDR